MAVQSDATRYASNGRNLPLTRAAHAKLQAELEELRNERTRHEGRFRIAREFGDSSTNDEMMALREEEGIIVARLARVEEILSRAEVVDEAAEAGVISIGTAVTVLDRDSGRTETYIVDGAHGSMDANVISALSPMGVGLIGRERGEIVDVVLPSGRVRTLTILDVAAGQGP